MLPSYFDYIFVHLRQKVRLRPDISPKFLLTLDPNPTRKARPDLQLCLCDIISSLVTESINCTVVRITQFSKTSCNLQLLFPYWPSSLPAVVAQPASKIANRTQKKAFCVGAVREAKSFCWLTS